MTIQSQGKPSILVLCTGNTARSQMTHCFLERELGRDWTILSAGTEPAAEIHPRTVEVMNEKGFDCRNRKPVSHLEYLGKAPVHTLIIVCDGAAKSCPSAWPGVQKRLFWPFEDPAAFEGSREEQLEEFREVRDAIEARVVAFARGEERDAD